MSQKGKIEFTTTENTPNSRNNKINPPETYVMEENISTDNFEALYSGRISGDVSKGMDIQEASKQQENDVAATSNLNKITASESDISRSYLFKDSEWEISSVPAYNYMKMSFQKVTDFLESIKGAAYTIQDTDDFSVERSIETLGKARNHKGDTIFYEKDDQSSENVTKSGTECSQTTMSKYQDKIISNKANMGTIENSQNQQRMILPYHSQTPLNAFSCRNDIAEKFDELIRFRHSLANENGVQNEDKLSSNRNDFDVSKTQKQFHLSKIERNLLAEDITPYARDENFERDNLAISSKVHLGEKSLVNDTTLPSASEKETTWTPSANVGENLDNIRTEMKENIEEFQPSTDSTVLDKPCSNLSLPKDTILRRPKRVTIKRKQSSQVKNPQQSKKKQGTPSKHLQELEVFVTNTLKESHPYLSLSKGTGLKMAALLMDIVQRIGDEAKILTAMADKRQIDSRVLEYAIKLCLERMKVEADVATGKRHQWLF